MKYSGYQALEGSRKEIRLLQILPHSGTTNDGPVHCHLLHASLSASTVPVYEAASYVWGSPAYTAVLHLDGLEVDVPASAEAVVRTFRLHKQTRLIWKDAICINQSDVDERSSQVSLMSDIYSLASRTIAYLGPPSVHDGQALLNLGEILDDMYEHDNYEDLLVEYENVGFPMSSWYRKSYDALVDLMSRPWFKRLWVLQEAVLPPACVVCFGEQYCDLDDLLRACRWLILKTPYNGQLIPCSRMARYYDRDYGSIRRDHQGLRTVWSLWCYANILETTDPRDKVFAIYGLLERLPKVSTTIRRRKDLEMNGTGVMMIEEHSKTDPQRQSDMDYVIGTVKPDYSKDIGAVYQSATRALMGSWPSSWVLSQVKHRTPEDVDDENYASWAIRLDRLMTEDAYYQETYSPWYNASQSLDSRPYAKNIHADPVLHLAGLQYDHIIDLFSIMPVSPDHSTSTQDMILLWRQVFDWVRPRQTTIDEKITATMTAECLDLEDVQRVSPAWLSAVSVILNRRLEEKETTELESDTAAASSIDVDDRLLLEFVDAAEVRCHGAVLFATAKGKIGLGTPAMAVGDTVNIIAGCKKPIVLRTHGTEHRFVSECYVNAIMAGEAVEELLAMGRHVREFKIV